GRCVVNSARKNHGMSVRDASIEWRRTHLEIERVTNRVCAGRVMRVQYEDLCANADRVLSSVFAFIGAPEAIAATTPCERRMHVLGNRARLNGLLPIQLDDSWQRELSARDLATFVAVTGDLNRRYRYGVARGER